MYVYPYDYPDKVFIGKFPVSTQIDTSTVNQLISIYNKTKWYLKNEGFNKPKKLKAPNARRRAIVSAYNLALNSQRTQKTA